MIKKKVTYIVSDIDKALAFEWVATILPKSKIDLNFIIFSPKQTRLEEFLLSNNIQVYWIKVNSKFSLIGAFFWLFFYLIKNNPDSIHCHLRIAEILGISAGFIAGIKNRIYTRHSSTYNHLFHPKGVIIDRIINKLATRIVAISDNVRKVLIELEHVPEEKIVMIHHGFDLDLFRHVEPNLVETTMKKYLSEQRSPVIGIIARYTLWKGFQFSIPAISSVFKKYPKGHLIIANAVGNHTKQIREILHKHLSPNQYTEIEFENNIPALYKIFDVYVHVPIDESVEAFGQTYVEALASKIPSVFTLSGVAQEFIRDRYNALVVDFKNTSQIEKAIIEIIESKELKNKLIENGQKSIESFNLVSFISQLETLYLNQE